MKIAICDDDNECRTVIHDCMQPYKDESFIIDEVEFSSGEELVEYYANGGKFDLIFLDILMKDVNGVDAAKRIRETDKNAIIIFITGYDCFVSDTFRVGAFQFLLKPLQEDDFRKDFERALDLYKINHHKYLIKWKEKTTAVEFGEIIYIEASSRHLFINTSAAIYECVGKISEEEQKLAGYHFVKCHQSYVINARHIVSIDFNKIQMSTGKDIPLSRHFRAKVKAVFHHCIAGSIV